MPPLLSNVKERTAAGSATGCRTEPDDDVARVQRWRRCSSREGSAQST